MKIKVCGMRDPENIRQVAALGPDMMGFIFYEQSPRYAGRLDPTVVRDLSPSIERVGVFVNAPLEDIVEKISVYGLHRVQLHGEESPECCLRLRERCSVIKAVSVTSAREVRQAATDYHEAVDSLLFDTRTPLYGGSGEQFDWTVLDAYNDGVPFILSGGIGENDAERLNALRWENLEACDLNSRFETEPGIKNTEALRRFFIGLRKK